MPTEHDLEIPSSPDAWCARVQREHPDLAVEVLGIFPAVDGTMMETIVVTGRDVSRAIETIRFTDSVHHFEVLSLESDACTLRIMTPSCDACRAAQVALLAPSFPLVLGGGSCRWRLQTTPEKARAFTEHLHDTVQAATLTRKRSLPRPSILTGRQHEILNAAVTQGYYARPRRISLSRLADHLGIRKSSLSQTLATIEGKLLPRWADRLADEE